MDEKEAGGILKTEHNEKRNILTPLRRDNSDRGTARTKKTPEIGVSEIQDVSVSEESMTLSLRPAKNRFLSLRNQPIPYHIDTFISSEKREQLAAKRLENPSRFAGKGFPSQAKGRRLTRNRATAREP